MKTSMKIDDRELRAMFAGLPETSKRSALYDAGQVVVNSTKVGYLKEISPDGRPWPANPDWWKDMKGGAATLTGPTSKKIHRGPFAGRYEFKNVNKKRMKNSLMINVSGSSSVTIEYDNEASKRAKITQEGGESQMILRSTTGKKDLKFNVKVQKRPHLGISGTYARIGGKTDIEHITDVFRQMVETKLMLRSYAA